MIDFMETLKVPEGMHVGRPLIMRPFQRKSINAVYTPVDENGLRIVRTAILSVAKKNGKTPTISGLCLGHLCGPEAKQNEQIFSGAFEREQAAIIFRYMSEMIYMDEELSDLCTIRESKKEIYCRANGSLYKSLSSEVKSKHGFGPAVLIFDELAQFGRDRTFFDTLQHGRGAHEEPLMWIISTQSPDDKAVLSELIDYGLSEKGKKDPRIRVFLYAADKDDDPYSVETWEKANPALGDFLDIKDMEEVANTAKNMPSAEGTFKNLRLNMRIDAAEHFISQDVWKANGAAVNMDTFQDHPCYGGLDLSGKNDLTSAVFTAEDDDGFVDVLSYFWAPGDNLREKEKRDKAPYTYWAENGFLEAKPGKTIDYGWVANKVGELQTKLIIAGIRFDRWRIEDFQRALDELGILAWVYGRDWDESKKGKEEKPDGLMLVPHGQGYKDMSPAIERMEDLLTDGKIRHGMHPVLTYCASNVRIQQDPAGNRKFDKIKSTGRIDGMVAKAMSLNKSGQVEIEKQEKSFWES